MVRASLARKVCPGLKKKLKDNEQARRIEKRKEEEDRLRASKASAKRNEAKKLLKRKQSEREPKKR